MNIPAGKWCLVGLWLLVLAQVQSSLSSAMAAEKEPEIRILELQGTVELLPGGTSRWVLTQTNQVLRSGDRLRSGENSRMALRWSDQSIASFGALTEIEILPPHEAEAEAGLHLFKGLLSFFHRDRPGRIRVLTQGATAGIEGTEFALAAAERNGVECTEVSVIDGRVRLQNAQGVLALTGGQQGIAKTGEAPERTAGFTANNLLQWCFYYPGIVDLAEARLTAEERQALKDSVAAYAQGDLLAALAGYPPARRPASDGERLFHAALLLSVGQVERAEASLAALGRDPRSDEAARLAEALRQLIAAVKRQQFSPAASPQLATELLAASYYEQSRGEGEASLRRALVLAQQAAERSPQFGFAWARIAELQFGFGRRAEAFRALEQALALAPRNAQALALKGFLLAGENRARSALPWFDRALAVDAALGNAWLGRGLCRIRLGRAAEGRDDLLVAAALEPQRSLLRSYLGKAFADANDSRRAANELARARQLDPADPTGWFYGALLEQQENRVNQAVTELEKAQELNDNRGLFRSRLLLDQDRATRGANLASLYRDAGMSDVSVREAAQAVTYDYANDAAHLFLADSFNELRDPTRFNLRYETAWFNEFLLANALAPVGGGRLAQGVSQQEYSRLFQADGFGIANSTLYRSDRQSVAEQASQFGTFGWTSYALDVDYEHSRGVRPNNDLDRLEWYTTVKQQITARDTVMALVKYEDYHSGDNFQYYNPTNARPDYQFDEYQHPIALGIWHHEWAPGVHTLVLGGRLENEQIFSDQGASQLLLFKDTSGNAYDYDTEPFDINYQNQLEIYTAEVNQIFRWDRVTLYAGARYQNGTFTTQTTLTNPPGLVPYFFENTSDTTNTSAGFERITGYGYLTLEPLDRVWVTGGLAYDQLSYPLNYRYPPVSSGETDSSMYGPKAAVVWQPSRRITLRGVFTRSLGGVSLDESYRLEPTQLAGFPQAFRSLISESVVGSVEAPEYQTFGAAVDLKFPTRTYAGLQFERLDADLCRTIGLYSLRDDGWYFLPDSTPEVLNYREHSATASLRQLVGDWFTLGASYRFTRSELDDSLPEISTDAYPSARQSLRANLHQTDAFILFNHPSGFFARADVAWYHQDNFGYSPDLPGDDFFQENLYAGWRFAQRRMEILLGILNLADQDYSLNSLTTYTELPRERTFIARLRFIF